MDEREFLKYIIHICYHGVFFQFGILSVAF